MSPKIIQAFLLSKDFIIAAANPVISSQPRGINEVKPLSKEEQRMYEYKPTKMRPGVHMIINQRLGIYVPICEN